MPLDKMIFVADISASLISFLGLQRQQIKIYRSKGLLAHILKRRHYKAAKYLDYIPEIINAPDYAGVYDGQIELVKIFKDNIFLSIKLDEAKNIYFVATLFDVSESKIEAYCRSGRLKKLDNNTLSQR
ncbi:MAG: hypothetical protein IJJ70_07970 [Treponema sp.]|nr:hypothetical protein [Treponema sp.]MBR0487619.1 hypothetical protein [Treponema sp.]